MVAILSYFGTREKLDSIDKGATKKVLPMVIVIY